ncbi:hypothetical protein KIW84_031394 [Lathyrus oleraceus]|uniref:Sugar phosphate transporter domain-containing protein n=1 Tax=Pisum sativum TaxID=3888 RepID=A0A9D4XSZ5_PEA|nr:hypothetical protein KIW84_031394 [Pisum sativum]
MFSFLTGKDARKILKRKDSDAGEKGRALEDLRASIFNQFNFSDGAKCQQRRLCGPATALTFNFVVVVGIIFVNKMMAKIAVTPSIVFAEFVLYRKKVSLPKVLALTVVSVGVVVAIVTDLQFHLFGACVALAWIVPSAVNKILWSRLQQQENWTALSLMWKTTQFTLPASYKHNSANGSFNPHHIIIKSK